MVLHRPLEASLLLALLTLAQPLLGAEFYRYVDDTGRTVFNSSIPPDIVPRGYEVLNERGQVVRVVPRALTPAEIAARDAAAAEQVRLEAEARAQREADAALKLKYRSPDEIATERDEMLAMLDADLMLARENQARAEQDLAAPEAELAEVSAAGGEVPETLTADVETKRQLFQRYSQQVLRLESEREALVATAERNMQRLRELLGLTEQPAAQ